MEKHSVLVIDHDPQVLFATSRILEQNRYQVTLALNGVSGMEFIQSSHYSLILSEFALEDVSGLAILEASRSTSPDTRVIFQTAVEGGDFRGEIFKLGADDYLFKPYDSEELLFKVRQHIDHYELRQKIGFQRNFVAGCCVCKRIRVDDKGAGVWMEVESFLKEKMNILLSSTYCPKCAQSVQDDLMVQLGRIKAQNSGRS
jgi:DNA-binding response OmpR family regulator